MAEAKADPVSLPAQIAAHEAAVSEANEDDALAFTQPLSGSIMANLSSSQDCILSRADLAAYLAAASVGDKAGEQIEQGYEHGLHTHGGSIVLVAGMPFASMSLCYSSLHLHTARSVSLEAHKDHSQ